MQRHLATCSLHYTNLSVELLPHQPLHMYNILLLIVCKKSNSFCRKKYFAHLVLFASLFSGNYSSRHPLDGLLFFLFDSGTLLIAKVIFLFRSFVYLSSSHHCRQRHDAVEHANITFVQERALQCVLVTSGE